jgi:hypothetical protein
MQLIFSTIFMLGYTAYLFPTIGKPIYFFWFAVGGAIGFVVTNLLFLSCFFFLFTPYAIMVRTIKKHDPLCLQEPIGKTMWGEHESPKNLKRYFRQY